MLIVAQTFNMHFTFLGSLQFFVSNFLGAFIITHAYMLNVSQTFNMPQTPMYKGFEACYVKWLNLFANCSHSQTLVANSYRHHKDSIYLADILGQTQLSTVCMLLLRKCWCLPYPNTSCGTPSRIVLFDV